MSTWKRNGMVWIPPKSTRPPVTRSNSATSRRRTRPWKESVVVYQASKAQQEQTCESRQ